MLKRRYSRDRERQRCIELQLALLLDSINNAARWTNEIKRLQKPGSRQLADFWRRKWLAETSWHCVQLAELIDAEAASAGE
jgi:hypothetical protein